MAPEKEPEVFGFAYRLYQQEQFRQAYDLLTDVLEKYPGDRRRLFEWRVSMAARMGEPALAESILGQALDEGNFYNEFSLRKDADLKDLQGRPVFEKMVERDLQMLASAQCRARPALTMIEPLENQADRVPMLMALHGNNSNGESQQGYWSPLAEKRWLVAIPQSSQVGGNGVFVWNDQAIAEKEIIAHYRALSSKFALDLERTIISGFSMGGYTALVAAIRQYFPVSGFLAVAPYIGDLQNFEKILNKNKSLKLRGYFLLGEEDEHCTPAAIQLHEMLKQRDIACGLEVFPGVGHAFPEDYRSAIDRAIHFILPE